jgi:hypothetical protein
VIQNDTETMRRIMGRTRYAFDRASSSIAFDEYDKLDKAHYVPESVPMRTVQRYQHMMRDEVVPAWKLQWNRTVTTVARWLTG